MNTETGKNDDIDVVSSGTLPRVRTKRITPWQGNVSSTSIESQHTESSIHSKSDSNESSIISVSSVDYGNQVISLQEPKSQKIVVRVGMGMRAKQPLDLQDLADVAANLHLFEKENPPQDQNLLPPNTCIIVSGESSFRRSTTDSSWKSSRPRRDNFIFLSPRQGSFHATRVKDVSAEPVGHKIVFE